MTRILLVEDDLEVQKKVCAMLTELGFEVLTIDTIDDTTYDLVINQLFDGYICDSQVKGRHPDNGRLLAGYLKRDLEKDNVVIFSGGNVPPHSRVDWISKSDPQKLKEWAQKLLK
ncbi:MAG TPA: hypothetical protein VLI92_00260 [Candidatus Saccharimonadales bacterium]|nr:hypothetical protein [Candidatus Saccharimonadales bacterium]